MKQKILLLSQVLQNMGMRYAAFRAWYEFQRRSGLLKRKFPTGNSQLKFIGLGEWQSAAKPFCFSAKEALAHPAKPQDSLRKATRRIKQGEVPFFNWDWKALALDDWHSHPLSGHRYNPNTHWTDIADLDPKAGDIKYVWEKARFSWVFTLLRDEHHNGGQHAAFVFRQIDSFIEQNPINLGPQWRCSQEMGLRCLNWVFVLYFYRNSPELTEERFHRILLSIYRHLEHIYQNIHFSRIAVRNNHAITEALSIYLLCLLFPWFPESQKWKEKAKKWFEEEIAYQVYEDGGYLQFSHNYHRVVVQLMSLGLQLARLNGESFAPVVEERAQASLDFLFHCQDRFTGWLPNYGANDGALFFPFSSNHFRDYRPQLQALASCFGENLYGPEEDAGEDWAWLGLPRYAEQTPRKRRNLAEYPQAGVYIAREEVSLTVLYATAYRDRPAQADNLHLDIWYQGKNILPDAGSYRYNTEEKWIRYFAGTESHNTLMLSGHDQMQKGPRFLWFFWPKAASGSARKEADEWVLHGQAQLFGHLGKGIWHSRSVRKKAGTAEWTIEDRLSGSQLQPELLFHCFPEDWLRHLSLRVFADGQPLQGREEPGHYSGFYGRSMPTVQQRFIAQPGATFVTQLKAHFPGTEEDL